MGQVKVSDTIIWIKHIHGDLALQDKLSRMPAGARIRVRVDGGPIELEKMRDRPDGPTPGLKPVGDSKEAWARNFYPRRRNEILDIRLDDGSPPPPAPVAERWDDATPQERDAAWQAFKLLTRAGWRSAKIASADRDDLHQR